MVQTISVQDGDWNTGSTWNTGQVPTSYDDVYIDHTVTIGGNYNVVAYNIYVRNGSLINDPQYDQINYQQKMTVNRFELVRKLNDDRVVRLDGINLILAVPCISSDGSGDGYPTTTHIINDSGVSIIDDPGVMGFSAQMQDIKPEGCARAYARKVSNAVRYMTITWHIKSDHALEMGRLYRMAESPYQVLVSTYSGVIKGYIESITPVDSVGKEYRSFRIMVAEGL